MCVVFHCAGNIRIHPPVVLFVPWPRISLVSCTIEGGGRRGLSGNNLFCVSVRTELFLIAIYCYKVRPYTRY